MSIWEVPTGAVDGSNRTFETSRPYAPGSVYYWTADEQYARAEELPGRLYRVALAPQEDDVVLVIYRSQG